MVKKKKKMRGGIRIGNNVRINSAVWANPIGGNTKTMFQVLPSGRVIIEDYCAISNVAFTSASQIHLHRNVSIGAGCRIFDTDFHPINPKYRFGVTRDDSKTKTAPIDIGEGAFIGAGVTILKGVSIGKYCVVGAGSVVTKSIPPFEIWAGNPAKKVKDLKLED